jgi:hypothetical protein
MTVRTLDRLVAAGLFFSPCPLPRDGVPVGVVLGRGRADRCRARAPDPPPARRAVLHAHRAGLLDVRAGAVRRALAVNIVSVVASALTILLTFLIIVRLVREWRGRATRGAPWTALPPTPAASSARSRWPSRTRSGSTPSRPRPTRSHVLHGALRLAHAEVAGAGARTGRPAGGRPAPRLRVRRRALADRDRLRLRPRDRSAPAELALDLLRRADHLLPALRAARVAAEAAAPRLAGGGRRVDRRLPDDIPRGDPVAAGSGAAERRAGPLPDPDRGGPGVRRVLHAQAPDAHPQPAAAVPDGRDDRLLVLRRHHHPQRRPTRRSTRTTRRTSTRSFPT